LVKIDDFDMNSVNSCGESIN